MDADVTGALSILWRGPLDSCNYACAYCPFAKRRARAEVLADDRRALARFVAWVEACCRPLRLLFTPWGEALVHAWYRRALVHLSRLAHVELVAIQTNGAALGAWARAADRERLAFWVSWHPTEIPLARFLARAARWDADGLACSIGCVAVPGHLAAVEELRRRLPPRMPMWINALRPHGRYGAAERARWSAIDPGFALDERPQASRGQPCRTGLSVIAVDGAGDIRRCHFVPAVLGNLYRDRLDDLLAPRACPRARCDCFIGYAHLPSLGLDAVYGDRLLARLRRPATAAFEAGSRPS